MESSVRFLTWVSGSLTAIIIGANWFVQAKILNCPDQNRGKLVRKLWCVSLILLVGGLVFLILAFVLWT